MGKRKFSAEAMIQAIRDTKGLASLAAKRLGCDPETVRIYAKRYPTVAAALQEERERMTDIAELSLYNQIQAGEGWAVCFYLKTQGRARGYVERHEYTGPDGTPMRITLKLSDEERDTSRLIDDTEPRRLISGNGNGNGH